MNKVFSLLVIDDEEYAVKGITQGIEWQDIGILNIFEAYDAASAMDTMRSEHIDIAICDIEMPGCNGIELMDWIRENSSDTKTIILTGHADFKYAQKAVQLDCDDYLLKPVEHEHLKQVVANTLMTIQKQNEKTVITETYKKYYKIWEQKKPYFIERFWQDILSGRTLPAKSIFTEAFQIYGINMDTETEIRLVLLKAEQWTENVEVDIREVTGLAVRNIACKILLDDNCGFIIQDQSEDNLAILYSAGNDEQAGTLDEKCRKLIDICCEELKCSLCCYIGEPTAVSSIQENYKKLIEIEHENINRSNSVFFQKDMCTDKKHLDRVPQLAKWSLLLELGRKDELLNQIHDFLYNTDNEKASCELLESFYHGIMSMLYALLHQNGISLSDALGSDNLVKDGSEISTIFQAEKWAKKIIEKAADYYNDFRKSESFIVSEIKDYIEKNIYSQFSREDIAAALYFNADYLSRVFKKETGVILSDYITFCRMKAAKKLLEETNYKIGDIALKLGYNQFSHFSKVFRNITEMSPQEYRKMFKKAI